MFNILYKYVYIDEIWVIVSIFGRCQNLNYDKDEKSFILMESLMKQQF